MNKIFTSFLLLILFQGVPFSYKIDKTERKPSKNNFGKLELPKYFYKRFAGTIGNKFQIIMNLSRKDSLAEGNYYYSRKGIPINFTFNSRIDDDGNVYLGEETGEYDTNYMPIVSGEFKGKFVNEHEIKGHWEKPGSNTPLEFSLEEEYPAGSAALDLKRYSKSFSNEGTHADIEFLLPVINNLHDKEIEKIINSNIERTFLKDYNFGEMNNNWKNYDEIMNDFINRYKEFISDTSLPKDYKPMWENSFAANVEFNSDYILSIENVEFRFEGGAHPITFFIYANYDLKTGKKISLADLFNENYKTELDKIGEKRFREAYNIKPDENFEQAGYFVDKGQFHLNNNFLITKGGLQFRFEQYEIGPYALGAPIVSIPYAELKDLINPDGLLSHFIK